MGGRRARGGPLRVDGLQSARHRQAPHVREISPVSRPADSNSPSAGIDRSATLSLPRLPRGVAGVARRLLFGQQGNRGVGFGAARLLAGNPLGLRRGYRSGLGGCLLLGEALLFGELRRLALGNPGFACRDQLRARRLALRGLSGIRSRPGLCPAISSCFAFAAVLSRSAKLASPRISSILFA